MVTFGFQGNDKIKFKKVYFDLVSKKKDNNVLQHLVASVNMKNPQSCFAQAFVRQGKYLWNFGTLVDDDFEQARDDLAYRNQYVTSNISRQVEHEELTLDINPDYLDSINTKQIDDQSQSNENEEVGDYRDHPYDSPGMLPISNLNILDESVRENMQLPRTKVAKKIMRISLADDDEEQNKDYSKNQGEGSQLDGKIK
jgi:hypothetical protein